MSLHLNLPESNLSPKEKSAFTREILKEAALPITAPFSDKLWALQIQYYAAQACAAVSSGTPIEQAHFFAPAKALFKLGLLKQC